MQKYSTVDLLTKKRAVSISEVSQYYVTDYHEAIIDKKTFDAVQVEINIKYLVKFVDKMTDLKYNININNN